MVRSAALRIVVLLWPFSLQAGVPPGAWSGNYPRCERHRELLKTGRLSLGVRFSTLDPHVTAAFVRALDFWATVLEMEWHKEDGRNCSIHVFFGNRRLFKSAEAARAQFPDHPSFQGWIAFNPSIVLSEDELYYLSVHELGHVFGLPHNPSAWSIMFFVGLDGPVLLDAADLEALAARHKIRADRLTGPVIVPTTQRSLQAAAATNR